jgi:hypothetical protein
MICLRSGHCCIESDVVVVVGDRLKMKPNGVACPNLSIVDHKATCLVHDEPWYRFTPCHAHGNPDIDPDHAGVQRACAYGLYHGKTKDDVLRLVTGTELKDLGAFRWNETDGILDPKERT